MSQPGIGPPQGMPPGGLTPQQLQQQQQMQQQQQQQQQQGRPPQRPEEAGRQLLAKSRELVPAMREKWGVAMVEGGRSLQMAAAPDAGKLNEQNQNKVGLYSDRGNNHCWDLIFIDFCSSRPVWRISTLSWIKWS